MTTRREALQFSLAGALLAALPRGWAAVADGPMKRAIPRSGEQIPVVGLGSSATFSQLADDAIATNDLSYFQHVVLPFN